MNTIKLINTKDTSKLKVSYKISKAEIKNQYGSNDNKAYQYFTKFPPYLLDVLKINDVGYIYFKDNKFYITAVPTPEQIIENVVQSIKFNSNTNIISIPKRLCNLHNIKLYDAKYVTYTYDFNYFNDTNNLSGACYFELNF